MPEDTTSSYDRGVEAGKVLSRLAAHDDHFTRINGSLEKVAAELHTLVLAVQHLEDKFAAQDATAVGTTKRWSLWRLGVEVLLVLVVLVILWWLFRALP